MFVVNLNKFFFSFKIIVRPRIDAVPFFNALDVGELRRQEYELCNQILNDVNYVRNNLPDACKKYQDSIGYYVFEGAHRK